MNIIEHNLMQEPEAFQLLAYLHDKTFDSKLTEDDFSELAKRENLITLIAYHEHQPASFKVGYTLPEDPKTLYSWIGGTLPEFQRKGYAWALMQRQHQRAKELGLTAVETKTRPRWAAMVELNKKAGFRLLREYIGLQCGSLKYHLRKDL